MKLWEILVPSADEQGREFSNNFHKEWDHKVSKITGGLTILRPVKGVWASQTEKMIPVRVACTEIEINEIAMLVAEHYSQRSVMYTLVSNCVIINNYVLPINKGERNA